MQGLFLALEGIDGAGKSSQIDMLLGHFRRAGRPASAVHFPRVGERPYGEMIAAFLRGDYGRDVDPRLTALLYALDRMRAAPEIGKRLNRGEVVVADRYVHSNIAYQCAKVAEARERERLADWIEDLEYAQHAIPRPDLALFLDAPLSFALGNLARRRAGAVRDYLEGKEDIHEADASFQAKVRDEFLRCAEASRHGLEVVDCGGGPGGMAEPMAVSGRILDVLRRRGVALGRDGAEIDF